MNAVWADQRGAGAMRCQASSAVSIPPTATSVTLSTWAQAQHGERRA
jgi:hypothetical protein